ncbi:MAG: hypothetical protein L7U87_04710 [Chlamydiales bacterium]|nr:hypothetical protein [Chlamydiales bacterium]
MSDYNFAPSADQGFYTPYNNGYPSNDGKQASNLEYTTLPGALTSSYDGRGYYGGRKYTRCNYTNGENLHTPNRPLPSYRNGQDPHTFPTLLPTYEPMSM